MNSSSETNKPMIPRACVIPICEGKKFNLVHKFPSDVQRSNEWLNAIQKGGMIEKLQDKSHDSMRKSCFVCARHFGVAAYKNVESRSLNMTAIPHLNLANLDDYSLSKAYQIEKSQQQIIADPKKTTPIVLNKLAINSKGPNSILKPVKRSYDDMQKSTTVFTAHSQPSINNYKEREVVTTRKNDVQPVMIESRTSEIQTSEIIRMNKQESTENPNGKLLALLEVNPAQYKKLLSVINSNANVVVNYNVENDSQVSTDNEIEVVFNEKQLRIDKFWLRDHCRCDKCYDHSTYQRKINILDFSDDINTKSVELRDENLLVTWDDDHKSTYATEFLMKSQHEKLLETTTNKILWAKDSMPSDNGICRVAMRDYMSDPEVSRKVLEALYLYGFAFIDGVQATQQNTEFVIRQLFPIHKTLFGEMWTFSDEKKDHMDTAYTNYYLGPHNDNTYFNDASGLQILHCISKKCTGGENFLIDGFQVAEKIKNERPETFERLTKTIVPAEYIEKEYHHKHSAPIINLDPITKEVIQIRYNLYDRAPLNTIPANQIRQFYKDLKYLASELENPDNRICFKLEPGTVLIFDNWRVLHGRNAYDGKRTMTGCYVQKSEFLSVLRLNGFIN